MKDFACQRLKPPDTSGRNPLEDTTSYKVGGKIFIVEPHFKESGHETISTILMKLMQSDKNVN